MNNDRRRKINGFEFINGTGICDCEDGRCNDYDSASTYKVSPFFADAVWSIMDSAGNLLLSKQADYGPKNISDAPGGPLNGLRVRMHDKIARINNLIDSGAEPENESLRDSFIDLLNYSAIAMMVLDGNWPSE
jgi:hypothetical protein